MMSHVHVTICTDRFPRDFTQEHTRFGFERQDLDTLALRAAANLAKSYRGARAHPTQNGGWAIRRRGAMLAHVEIVKGE